MAGRPMSPYGGQSGLLYGLIAFAFVSVASLGLFVFQLTKNKAAENRAQSAEQRLEQYGQPPQYYADEGSARRTKVFTVMTGDLQKVAAAVTGVEEDLGPTVVAKVGQAMKDVAKTAQGAVNANDAALPALTALSAAYAKEKAAAADLTRQVADLQDQTAALTAQLKTTRDQFESQTAALRDQLAQAQSDKTEALAAKDRQLRDVQASLDATEAQLQAMKREGNMLVRDKDIEIGQRDALIAELQDQIQALKPGTFDPRSILTKADGRIMRAIPGSDVVYINLGATNKMKPGMGFEVYAPNREASSDLRGKASIEVVTVMEETAECRVTRRAAGQPILEGDLVVNIAYERNRSPKFVVRGDFDLNYDGVIDHNGVEEMTALIRQWGGQIAEDLDESVDYVVIGLPPGTGEAAVGATATAVVRDQLQQRELERSKFKALVERAQKMFIPVITQNQFLYLTGFTGDAAVARR